jgi:6-phosphogluconolactonase
MTAPKISVAKDKDALIRAAAQVWVDSAKRAIAARGVWSIALSGGSTPKPLYELMAAPEFRERIDWKKCHFWWGDERYVPHDHPDSNYGMANNAMLSKVPVPRENVHPVPTEIGSPQEVADAYEKAMWQCFGRSSGIPQIDFNLLGLGDNGHTASLFPHTELLYERKRLVAAGYIEEIKTNRITMTVPVLNHARQIVFLVAGANKADVVRDVIYGPRDPERLPAQLIAADSGTLEWLLDAPAAAKLPK